MIPHLNGATNDVYFADGNAPGKDLQVMDRESVPKANRLMAELFGSEEDLGLSYRNHRVPNVRGETSPQNLRKWFAEVGPSVKSGDRLIIYVTAHGRGSRDRRNTHNTTIAMWDDSSVTMSEFVGLLDEIDREVQVVCVMVQCHAGGFARMIFEGGNPNRGLAKQKRIGVFATVHDRQAAGCTPEVDEASYEEYSTYFWAAVSGVDRLGKRIKRPDYDGNGQVSLEEAHAYTVLTSNTIDLPIITSGEFLTQYGRYGNGSSNQLNDDASYDSIIAVASPAQKAVLEGLSKQLGLSGNNRVLDAERQGRNVNTSRSRFRRRSSPAGRLRTEISRDVQKKWPGLANVMNPIAIELLTTRKDEFIQAVESHRKYAEYRRLADVGQSEDQKKRVKYERFLRTVDNVIFAENLRRSNREELKRKYESLVELERQPFFVE